jgi:NAD(P)-dependent dehydrogenase (short-subunit alcohol dehydrogenase family)
VRPAKRGNLEYRSSFGWFEETPVGCPGQPNEVAPVVLFNACDGSSYMSGQVLHPNGGTIVNG